MLEAVDGGVQPVPSAKKSKAIPVPRQKIACSMEIIPCSIHREFARNIMKLHAYPGELLAITSRFYEISLFFPVDKGNRPWRPVWRDCVHHHPVLSNHGGFPVLENTCEFNGLSRLKCGLRSRLCVLHPFCGRKRRPISTDKIPFPKLTDAVV
jgi:hypothetical protein